jgi:hypothetical protein
MSYKCLKSDKRRKTITKHWTRWLRETDRWYGKYIETVGVSPFDFHEVAAVGFLSCAAARAGFLTLNEYQLVKHSQEDRRRKVPGRADLWMTLEGLEYSFEFKRAWYTATKSNLKAMLEVVRGDIHAVPSDECHYAAGGLIAYVNDEKRVPTYEEFAATKGVHMAYRIGPQGEGAAYLYFSFRGR